jgi:hypothetical protein
MSSRDTDERRRPLGARCTKKTYLPPPSSQGRHCGHGDSAFATLVAGTKGSASTRKSTKRFNIIDLQEIGLSAKRQPRLAEVKWRRAKCGEIFGNQNSSLLLCELSYDITNGMKRVLSREDEGER